MKCEYALDMCRKCCHQYLNTSCRIIGRVKILFDKVKVKVEDSIFRMSSAISESTTENSADDGKGEDHTEAIDVDIHEFRIPVKELANQEEDVVRWQKSEAYRDLLGFIMAINEAVKGKRFADVTNVSSTVEKLLAMLETLSSWIDAIPPVEQPQRFGNKAFRDFFAKLQDNAESLLKDCLEEKFHRCCTEVSTYLVEAVGNDTRIDYGSGHEMAFAAFLCCLYKVGVLKEADAPAVGLKVFQSYMELVRKLQTVYRMEPAGSHGVWSLDDYQFIPFIWGSSQLIEHRVIRPKSFVKPDIYEYLDKDYMFLGCIKYISQVKTGPFHEHSNQLWNISGVKMWAKVNSGLIKMYKAEVLAKFPVVQHFLFGSLLSIRPAE